MTSSSDRSRAACGYGILVLIGIFELIVLILGGISFGGAANDTCVGPIQHLTLPLWMMIGGIIGSVVNTLYLCLYTPAVCCDTTCCNDRSDHMSGIIVFMMTGPCVIGFFLVAILFRIVWFILGAIIINGVSQQCSIDDSGLKTLAIFYLVSMFFSTIGKGLVSISVCPCCM